MKRFLCILVFLCVHLLWALNPIKEYVDFPTNSKLSFEEVTIKTNDGFNLKSWVCFANKTKEKNRTLVLAYGDAGNMSYYLRQTVELVNQGYNVVLFDYRGFGESDNFSIDENVLYYDEFATDLQAVVAYAKEKFNTKVGVWALSMGTISAVLANDSSPLDYLIADGFVISPNEVVKKMDEYLQKEIKLPSNARDYDKALSRLSIPILFFAGDRDGLTTVYDSNKVKLLNPKSQVVVYKGGHLQGFQAMTNTYHGQGYIEAIDTFYVNTFNTNEK